MAVNYDLVYYQNVHYNSTESLLDSNHEVTFQAELLDKQCNYNVAVNKFKISDMSSIPLGFNLPFDSWECGLKVGSNYARFPVAQIGSSATQVNNLFTLEGSNILYYNYINQAKTLIQTINLSNGITDGLFCVADSNNNFYVANSGSLFVYDPTGELLVSQEFTNIVYLDMSLSDQIIITDQGVESVFVYTYNGTLNLVHTIAKNFAGDAFVNLSSCSFDSTNGIITYNANSFSLIDSGFNVLKDTLAQANITSITGSEIISSKGLAYVIDNTSQPITSANTFVTINSNNYAIELYSITAPNESTLQFSFTPLNSSAHPIFPKRAFYDTKQGVYWATDFTTIYTYGSTGDLIYAKTMTNIVYSFLAPDSKFLVCENYIGNSLLEVWKLSNNQIIEIGVAIRQNTALQALTNISCCASDGQTIVLCYGSTVDRQVQNITFYSNTTYAPLYDYNINTIRYIQDVVIDTANEQLYLNVVDYLPAIFANTNPYVNDMNLVNVNELGGAVTVLSPTSAYTSISMTPEFQFIAQYNVVADPPTSNAMVCQTSVASLSTTSAFNNYSTGVQPFAICPYYNNEVLLCNLGIVTSLDGLTNTIYGQFATNVWTEYTTFTNPIALVDTPMRISSNPLDGSIWINFSNSLGTYKSSVNPTVLSEAPYLDFTHVSWVAVNYNLPTLECICWDPIVPNTCYGIGGLGNNYIYKGYYNNVASELIFQLYLFNTSYSYYLTIPNATAYTIGSVGGQLQKYTVNGSTLTLDNFALALGNTSSLCMDYKSNLLYTGNIAIPTQINEINASTNEFTTNSYPIVNLGFISKPISTYTSQVVAISIITMEPTSFNTFDNTYLTGIARNVTNDTILVSAVTLNEILGLDDTMLYQKFAIPYTAPSSIFANTGLQTKGNDLLQVYDYNDYINQVNLCFRSCLVDLVKQNPSIVITNFPSFQLNRLTGLMTMTYDPSFASATNGIYMNDNLYQYFKFPKTMPVTIGLQNLYKLTVNETGTIDQQSLSLYQLNQLDKIVLQTSLNIYSDVTASAIRSLNIFTEFDIDTSNISTMYNEGCLLYSAVLLRNYNMLSTNALRTVQYSFYYQYLNGERYKLYITSGNNVSLKLQFTRVY